MEQKRVSFKVANALKEAGYPQDKFNYNKYYTKGGNLSCVYQYGVPYYDVVCFAPTYLDVWLWLWREKGIKFEIVKNGDKVLCKEEPYIFHYMKDPEEAIIAAIEYLFDND